MGREVHFSGVALIAAFLDPKASARSREMIWPKDRPSFFWRFLISFRIGVSMSTVVRAMMSR